MCRCFFFKITEQGFEKTEGIQEVRFKKIEKLVKQYVLRAFFITQLQKQL